VATMSQAPLRSWLMSHATFIRDDSYGLLCITGNSMYEAFSPA
jgi:hypothetical protein